MTYNREELARAASVEPEYIERVLDGGIISDGGDGTFTRGDLRRVTLIQTLERAGLPFEEIARTIDSGLLSLEFMDASSYDRFSNLTDTTFAELSRATEVPIDLLMMVREAVGSAHPEAADRVRDIELSIVRLVEMQVELGFRHSVIERWLRVYGESMRRVAETEADWWQTEVEQRLADSGLGASDVMTISDVEVAERMAPLLDDAILAIYHGHQEHAWTNSIINGIEAALAEGGVFSRLKKPPAICFLDLTGYTRLTSEQGDDRAADVADELARIVQRASRANHGTPVKWLGDGVMFHFREPGNAVGAALTMIEEITRSGLPPGHVGIHAGPVLFQGGDYFGQTVNLAARITDYARPGEVLVSEPVVEQSESVDAAFADVGDVELKGIAGSTRLFSASRR